MLGKGDEVIEVNVTQAMRIATVLGVKIYGATADLRRRWSTTSGSIIAETARVSLDDEARVLNGGFAEMGRRQGWLDL